MIGALIGLPVTLVKFPVLLLTSPVRVARIASEKAKRSGILPVPIGGTSYKAHQILFAVKQAAQVRTASKAKIAASRDNVLSELAAVLQNEEDDTAAELWLSALHAAQAAADDILES